LSFEELSDESMLLILSTGLVYLKNDKNNYEYLDFLSFLGFLGSVSDSKQAGVEQAPDSPSNSRSIPAFRGI
jgi:hypothetical protein